VKGKGAVSVEKSAKGKKKLLCSELCGFLAQISYVPEKRFGNKRKSPTLAGQAPLHALKANL
jgi:hypothetical protein